MNKSTSWGKIRDLFRTFQDAFRHQLEVTGRPGVLVSQLFIIKFLESFCTILTALIFPYICLKVLVLKHFSYDSPEFFYTILLWVLFYFLAKFLQLRVRVGWMITLDEYYRLGRFQSVKLAFKQGKKFLRFWKSAVSSAKQAPRNINRTLLAQVEFYRLLLGYKETVVSEWFSEDLQTNFNDMTKRLHSRLNFIFYASVFYAQWYTVLLFFPELDVFQSRLIELVQSSKFNATNILALSISCALVYSFWIVRNSAHHQINLALFSLRIAENDNLRANQCRLNVLELDREVRHRLGGFLRGELAMNVHLLILPALTGILLYFLTDFFSQVFVFLLILQCPEICRSISGSRIFTTIRLVKGEHPDHWIKLRKLSFLILEIIFLVCSILFLLPFFCFIPVIGNLVYAALNQDIILLLPMSLFALSVCLLAWCKNAVINQRESYQHSFLLMMFTAALSFMILKHYFFSFIYSLPALGLVCWRLTNKMRRGVS